MNLQKAVIVIESPNKAEKFKHCTGAKIIATIGHFKEIPATSLGVDLKTYTPTFRVAHGKLSVVEALKRCKGKDIYIATDPDREGFAIGTHVYSVVRPLAKSVFRVEVREITDKGIKEALAAAIPWDKTNSGSYDAFLGRRVGDRLIGYLLSPDISNILRAVYTVGRVQSPGLRLVVDREGEIERFNKSPYYQVKLVLIKNEIEYAAFHEQGSIKERKIANDLIAKINQNKNSAEVLSIENNTILRAPRGPFTTSTLQQAACNRLKISAEKTMELAQGLFEKGLITYHRTDSQRLSIEFIQEIQAHIKEVYGARYCHEQPVIYKSKNSQAEAHEGIRQTKVHQLDKIPDKIKKNGLGAEHEDLYRLICSRAMACQMTKAEYIRTTAKIKYGEEIFNAAGTALKFDGWARIYEDKTLIEEEENEKPPILQQGEKLEIKSLELIEKETRPPQRYTEATLVKELEKKGIGRPSTYAAILKTLKGRRYIIIEKGSLVPTDEGKSLISCLNGKYPWVIDYDFTKQMEDYLDKVQDGKASWREFARALHQKIGFNEPPAWKVGNNKNGGNDNGKRASRNRRNFVRAKSKGKN